MTLDDEYKDIQTEFIDKLIELFVIAGTPTDESNQGLLGSIRSNFTPNNLFRHELLSTYAIYYRIKEALKSRKIKTPGMSHGKLVFNRFAHLIYPGEQFKDERSQCLTNIKEFGKKRPTSNLNDEGKDLQTKNLKVLETS